MFCHVCYMMYCIVQVDTFCCSSSVPLASQAMAMKCNVCDISGPSNFISRDVGTPCSWWCHACYDKSVAGIMRTHEIEHPILCWQCNELPATLRSQSQALAAPTKHWQYWCFVCYEREDHKDLPHDIHDLESASDEPEQQDEPDQEDEEPHEDAEFDEHADQEDSAPQIIHSADDEPDEYASLRSFSSWQREDEAFSPNSWQEEDD